VIGRILDRATYAFGYNARWVVAESLRRPNHFQVGRQLPAPHVGLSLKSRRLRVLPTGSQKCQKTAHALQQIALIIRIQHTSIHRPPLGS
jgi:hypothetical protein